MDFQILSSLLVHKSTNLLFLLEFSKTHLELDDRHKKE